jgi:hypothetical protein
LDASRLPPPLSMPPPSVLPPLLHEAKHAPQLALLFQAFVSHPFDCPKFKSPLQSSHCEPNVGALQLKAHVLFTHAVALAWNGADVVQSRQAFPHFVLSVSEAQMFPHL